MSLRIVFMGTPEFAVPSLDALVNAGYQVVGAFTQPDRPAGRGNKLTACPVKLRALERGVPVYQFERIRRREGVQALSALQPDLCVTAAFGQILPQRILDIPPLGTLNVHASLLPKYRGAAPINWCIAKGESVSGVTIMFTDAGIDTGDIAMMRETPIGETETAGALSERLSAMGAALLVEAVRAVEQGNCPRMAQDHAQASHYPMLTRDMGRIDFECPAREIAWMVRGFTPWPGAFTYLNGAPLKLLMARAIDALGGVPGEVMRSDAKQGLVVACGEGALEIVTLQAAGARPMDAAAYLRGKPIPTGIILGEQEH